MMKKILGFTITLCLALLTASCKKEAEEPGPQEPEFEQSVEQQEPRWLVVLHPEWAFGPKYERIDVTDWEPGEDVVSLGEYGEYYPWQGEDTIEFRFENGYLWVNGRRVGVNLGIGELEASDVENPNQIITAHVGWGQIPELKRFPNLITAKLSMRSFPREEKYHKSLEEIPEHVRVYVRTFPYDESWWQDPNITDENLAVLAQIKNLRGLNTISDRLTDLGMRHLRRCKNLRQLDIGARKLTNLSLRYIGSCKNLRYLSIGGRGISSKGLRYLRGLSELRELDITGFGMSDEGLKNISELKNLRVLSFSVRERLSLADLITRITKGLGPRTSFLQEFGKLFSPVVTARGWEALASLPGLKDLSVYSGEYLGNDVLMRIAKMKSLRVLYFGESPLTDSLFMCLKGLDNLEHLSWGDTNVTLDDSALFHLSELPRLRELFLEGSWSNVTDEGLKYLPRFKNLKKLWLGPNVSITDSGMINVAELKGLEDLTLTWKPRMVLRGIAGFTKLRHLRLIISNDISREELASLKYLKSLKELEFWGSEFPSGGLSFLPYLEKLEVLDLSYTNVTDADLRYLKGLVNLRDLNLSRTEITDAGLLYLEGLTNLERLDLSETAVTDSGLAPLSGLKKLKSLSLTWAKVSQAITHSAEDEFQYDIIPPGLDSLMKALPDCWITY